MSASSTRTASRRDPADRKRAEAHADRILSMLTAAGSLGCTNAELWTVCHPVNSRISDLRKRGHNITAKSEGGGIWRYRFIPPEPARSGDWYERETGRKRSTDPPHDLGGLFDGVRP